MKVPNIASCPPRNGMQVCVILARNGVPSGIRGSGGKGDEKPTRRAAQKPECIRARPSPLLSASPSPTEAE
eukprot:4219276-Pleurochrysis_carterae.AAC.1